MEKDIIKPKNIGLEIVINDEVFSKQLFENLLQQLQQNEVNEDYIRYFYLILKKADKFVLNSTKKDVERAIKEHGVKLEIEGSDEMYYEANSFNNKDESIMEVYNKKNANVKYIVEHSIKCIPDVTNYERVLLYGEKPVFKYKVFFDRNSNVVDKLEEITEYVNIRKINSFDKILDFHIPVKFRLSEVAPIESERFKKIIDFKSFSFFDNYGDFEIYMINSVKSLERIGSYDVISFNGRHVKKLDLY